jgi:hypothetical protein
MTVLQIPGPIQFKTLGPAWGRLKTNATTLRSKGSDELFSYNYNVAGNFVAGSVQEAPTKNFHFTFQPGDIIMKMQKKGDEIKNDHFHIWIIEDASADSFVTLDSTSTGQKGPDRTEHRDFSQFTKIAENGKKDNLVVTFARPKAFSDINELSRRYVSYLKDKYS